MCFQVDDVDDVLANINEQNDAMEQINAAMGQPIGPSADIDEDDLEKEFEVRVHCLVCCSAHRCPYLACRIVLCCMCMLLSTSAWILGTSTGGGC